MFYLELTTGIRRGEFVTLLWDDLDLENQTLTISVFVNEKVVQMGTKKFSTVST